MAMNNHMEARRRQMFMERVCAARRRLESQQTQENQEGASSAFTSQSEPLLSSDGGPSKTARLTLSPYRVNEEGHKNRYRNRQHLAPHCDKAFAIMYPGCDNTDYVSPETHKTWRENSFIEKYEISNKVNGTFEIEGLKIKTPVENLS